MSSFKELPFHASLSLSLSLSKRTFLRTFSLGICLSYKSLSLRPSLRARSAARSLHDLPFNASPFQPSPFELSKALSLYSSL